MDTDAVLFWNLCLVCLAGMVVTLARLRSNGLGWALVLFIILAVGAVGHWGKHPALIYVGIGMWFVFVLLPGLLGKVFQRHLLAQRYDLAYRWGRVIGWLHPADGWRQQPEIVRALDLAQKGNVAAALVILEELKGRRSLIGLSALIYFFRITHRWHELLAWERESNFNLRAQPSLLPVFLRAHGETGDIRGMVRLYSQHHDQIGQINPPSSRDMCRLVLFVFCGKHVLVEGLFAGSLSTLPAPIRTFWMATTDLAAGHHQSARQKLESILPEADPSLRLAIEQRMAQLNCPPLAPDPTIEAVVQFAAEQQHHDDRFAAQRTLFSKSALVTQLLIGINVVMFAVEILMGGSENFETLYRLGAMFAPSVLEGQWWRLGSSLFLHFGVLHVAMNMFALWVLGPFVEFSLGARRYLFVYLTAGIGSMGLVLALSHATRPEQFTVGASGAIMGLIGATGALLLRGWLRDKALVAKQKLFGVFTILAMQTVFDAMIPEVSMTAHLSGACVGFVVTLVVARRR